MAADRDARLQRLVTATEEWANKRTAQHRKQVDFNKSVLEARPGSDKLAKGASSAASELVAAAIDDFLLA
jgi:hypothetical protein